MVAYVSAVVGIDNYQLEKNKKLVASFKFGQTNGKILVVYFSRSGNTGSPIWLYSPAPPVFEFVRNNDFTGKKVVLFTSLNSKFEQKCIDDFSALVKQNGGDFITHVYVVRGRMTQQMSTEALLESVKTKVVIATKNSQE